MEAIDKVIELLEAKEKDAWEPMRAADVAKEIATARWYPWYEALELAKKVKAEGEAAREAEPRVPPAVEALWMRKEGPRAHPEPVPEVVEAPAAVRGMDLRVSAPEDVGF